MSYVNYTEDHVTLQLELFICLYKRQLWDTRNTRPPHRGYFVYLTHLAYLPERFTQTDEIFMFTGVPVKSLGGPAMRMLRGWFTVRRMLIGAACGQPSGSRSNT